MTRYFVDVVTQPGASPRAVELVGERVVVGSAPNCAVVIERPGVAREHVLLSARPEGCYVAVARGAEVPVLHSGVPIERATVPWGSALDLAGARLTLRRDTGAAARSAGVSPVLVIATLLLLPLCAWMLLSSREDAVPRATVPPPTLLDPLERPCGQSDPQQARALAAESARAALAREERAPFAAQDGIAAVNLHAVAAACFRVAGAGGAAEGELAAARALSARLEDAFRNHRFRLDRALDQGRIDDALLESQKLVALCSHRRGPYLDWLVALERRLRMKSEELAAEAAAAAAESGGGS